VDDKKVLELDRVDLEPYRGKSREEISVSVSSFEPHGECGKVQLNFSRSSMSLQAPVARLAFSLVSANTPENVE
jgi:hypothetical protein